MAAHTLAYVKAKKSAQKIILFSGCGGLKEDGPEGVAL